MSNIVPILKREYLTRIRTKGFWISTLIVPLFLIAIMFVPILLAEKSKPNMDPIVVVDLKGDFYLRVSGDPTCVWTITLTKAA